MAKAVGMFFLMAMAMFMVLYITLQAGDSVDTTTSDGTTTWTTTYLTGGSETSWIGYIYLGFGILSFMGAIQTFWSGE